MLAKQRDSLRIRRSRGFTLLEGIAWLAMAAVVTGGAAALVATATDSRKITKGVQDIGWIAQGIERVAATRFSYVGISARDLIVRGYVPQALPHSNNTVFSPWGTTYGIVPINGSTYRINVTTPQVSTCLSMLDLMSTAVASCANTVLNVTYTR